MPAPLERPRHAVAGAPAYQGTLRVEALYLWGLERDHFPWSRLIASQPVEAFVLAAIAAQGGWDVCVFERIEAGESQTDVARSFGVSQGWLSRVIHKDPELTRRYNLARKGRARVYAEEAKTLADAAGETSAAVAKVREQIGVRRWLAAVDDRETFGEQAAAVNVQVNVGDWHLNSLRHRIVQASAPPAVALGHRDPALLGCGPTDSGEGGNGARGIDTGADSAAEAAPKEPQALTVGTPKVQPVHDLRESV